MIKSTPEFEARIKASKVPVLEITLEQLSQSKLATEEEIWYLRNIDISTTDLVST